jgi:hypothetical protein
MAFLNIDGCRSDSVDEKTGRLETALRKNLVISRVLDRAPLLKLPNWYLGAGCIAQTVWNELHSFPPSNHIKDYDLVYFDGSDLSYEAEDMRIKGGRKLFRDLNARIEIRNQARVHLWYKKHFSKTLEYLDDYGKTNSAYKTVEDAIATWPTTATSIGVKLDEEKRFVVYAPFGLDDLFDMVVRPNKKGVPKEVYLGKVERWTKIWPRLKVVPWD